MQKDFVVISLKIRKEDDMTYRVYVGDPLIIKQVHKIFIQWVYSDFSDENLTEENLVEYLRLQFPSTEFYNESGFNKMIEEKNFQTLIPPASEN